VGSLKGRGSVYYRKDRKRWVAQLDLGYDEHGKRSLWRYMAPADQPDAYADAKAKLARAIVERGRGVDLVPHDQSTAEYLDYWLEQVVRPGRAPRTLESYSSVVRLHLSPALGKVPIRSLSPVDVVSMFGRMRAKGLGARTQELAYAVLHSALRQAVKWGLTSANVCDRVDKPKYKTVEKATFTPAEVATFLRAIQGDRLEALWIVALALGLRRGEVTGLRWQDVDLAAGVIRSAYQLQRVEGRHVLRKHKTARSKRTLPLSPYVAEALRAHRVRQLEERLRAGERWADTLGLVFTTPVGNPLDGSRVSERFKELIQGAGLPDLDLHDLRHTAGSLLASLGTPAPVIRDLLGHSQLATTDRYLHTQPAEHVEALNRLSRLLEQR
jgi:integrase